MSVNQTIATAQQSGQKPWSERITAFRVLVLDLSAIIGLIAILGVIAHQIINELVNRPMQFAPILVPKNLEEAGHAPETLTQRIVAFTREIQQQAAEFDKRKATDSLRPIPAVTNQDPLLGPANRDFHASSYVAVGSVAVTSEISLDTQPDFVVPGLGFSTKALVEYVRDLIGFPSNRLRGEVIKIGEEYELRLRFDGALAEFVSGKVAESDLDDALRAGAEKIQEHADKCTLILYLHLKKRSNEALALLDQLIADNPDDEEEQKRLHSLRGIILFDKGDLPNAIASFERVTQAKDPTSEAFVNLASVLHDNREYDRAIEAADKATELAPDNGPAHLIHGAALLANGDYDAARTQFERVIALDPKNADAHFNLGTLRYSMGEFGPASESFREAIRLKPGLTNAHLQLGYALDLNGDLNEAIKSYREAVRIDARDADAQIALAFALYFKGELDSSLADETEAAFREAHKLSSESKLAGLDSWALSGLCLALGQRGQHVAAVTHCEQSVLLDPSNAALLVNLGEALNISGKTEKAIEQFKAAAELDPMETWAYADWGNALFDKGEREEALAKFDQAIALETGDMLAHAFHYAARGFARHQMGREAEALSDFRGAVTVSPKFAIGYMGLGHALKRMQRQAEALAACQKAAEYGPIKELPPYDLNFGISGAQALSAAADTCRTLLAEHLD